MIMLQAFAALQGGRVAGETSRQWATYWLARAAPTSEVQDACADALASTNADSAKRTFTPALLQARSDRRRTPRRRAGRNTAARRRSRLPAFTLMPLDRI